jgi:hypothetical protein
MKRKNCIQTRADDIRWSTPYIIPETTISNIKTKLLVIGINGNKNFIYFNDFTSTVDGVLTSYSCNINN